MINVGSNEQAVKMLLNDWPDNGEHASSARAIMERPDDPGTLYAAKKSFEEVL